MRIGCQYGCLVAAVLKLDGHLLDMENFFGGKSEEDAGVGGFM